MEISVTIVADSITTQQHRLTTIQYILPTYLLAELNTHRQFSRNARSARATPTSILLEEVSRDPVIPYMGKDQRGMVAGPVPSYISEEELHKMWLDARDSAVAHTEQLDDMGVHKQTVNRLLNPFMWTHGIISSTSWENFLTLRSASNAEPLMQEFALALKKALDTSEPTLLYPCEWHLPYINKEEFGDSERDLDRAIQISVARCARVSTNSLEKSDQQNIELYNRLLADRHMSPFEHVARVPRLCDRINIAFNGFYQLITRSSINTTYGNFQGWLQLRKIIEWKI